MKNTINRSILLLLLVLGGCFGAINAQQPTPVANETNYWRSLKKCNDPWVTGAVIKLYDRMPHTTNGTDFECDISRYNDGRWNSFDELYRAVSFATSNMKIQQYYFETYDVRGTGTLVAYMGPENKPIILALVGNDGGSLIGNDGSTMQPIYAKMVAAGGGNMVAAGGGNFKKAFVASMVAAGAGNVIPTAGGSFPLTASLIERTFASSVKATPVTYSLSSVEKRSAVKAGSRAFRVR